MDLLLISVFVSVVGAVLSLLLSKKEDTAKKVACFFGTIASAIAVIAGVSAVLDPAGVSVSFATPFSFADFSVMLNGLNGLLLVAINILGFVAWIYGISYFDEYKGMGLGAIGFFMNAFIASMNLVLTVDNAFWFLVFFELMSLSSYFLVIIEQKPASIRCGFLYLSWPTSASWAS